MMEATGEGAPRERTEKQCPETKAKFYKTICGEQ